MEKFMVSAVSHLLFANDSLILCKETEEDAAHLKEILGIYEQCSGQVAILISRL